MHMKTIQWERLRRCQGCPQRLDVALRRMIPHNKVVTYSHRCNLCKCFLRAKTAIPSERCPAGIW